MKFLSSQLAYFFNQRQTQRNLRALFRYIAGLAAVILLYSVLFHVIMVRVEGQQHSWLTGIYWTLTVMSTLGFGDITFTSDVGRLFSTIVLLTGIVMLLVLLPFLFIRLFFAPWLEARVRARAPRAAPDGTAGHVIICSYDSIAPVLIKKLRDIGIPYFLIEPDPHVAAERLGEGISVVTGEVDGRETYEALRTAHARMVVANAGDAANTNITLTAREAAPSVPVAAVVESEDAVDILDLSGADHVLPLKQQLGAHLANRVDVGHAEAHVIGRYRDLLIAELPIQATPVAGRTIRETRLREATGVSIIAVWERGKLLPARPDTFLSDKSVPVVIGTAEQMAELDALLVIYTANEHPVLVIGGGRVGAAAVRALKDKGVPVAMIERDPAIAAHAEGVADRVIVGDAADRAVLDRAGLARAPSVLLTTHDDAINIYLAVYCRRLNPELRIVSRITHERNVEAVLRAGADFVLSYASLGAETIISLLQGRSLIILGEGFDVIQVPVPRSLVDTALGESGIGARTGLNVIAVQQDGQVITQLPASFRLRDGAELLMIGSPDQRQAFRAAFP